MRTNLLKRLTAAVAMGVFALGVSGGGVAVAKTDLLVYTSIEADELSKLKNAFEKATMKKPRRMKKW